MDAAHTACDAPHASEVVSLGTNCGQESLLRYLGGVPGTDILRPGVSYKSSVVGEGAACLLHAPAGSHVDSRAADSLLTARDDVWRWCIDDESGRDVGCDAPHTAEVVGVPTPGGVSLDCARQADSYAETVLADDQRQLAVKQSEGSGGARCLIEVRGDTFLLTSLRRLYSGSLPIQAR